MKASEMIKCLQEKINIHGDFELIKQGDDEGNYYNIVSGLDMDSWNGQTHDPFFQSQVDDADDIIEDSVIVGVIY